MRLRAIVGAVGLALAVQGAPVARAANDVAGVPAALVGRNGPTQNHLSNLELVAHVPMKSGAETREGNGNNGAPALVSSTAVGAPAVCAYVGRWHDYTQRRAVNIVDVDPASSTYLQIVGAVPDATLAAATSRELRAVDLPGYKMLAVMTFSSAFPARPDRKLNTLRLYDFPTGDCRAPRAAGIYDLLSLRPHEFYLWIDPDPAHNVAGHPRVLAYFSTPFGPVTMVVADVSNPALPLTVAAYDAGQPLVSQEEASNTFIGNYLHSMSLSPDGRRAFLSYWDGGFLTVDTSDLAAGLPGGVVRPLGLASVPYDYSPPGVGNTHSAVLAQGVAAPGGGDVAVVGDEVYGGLDGCPFGWMRLVAVGGPGQSPSQIGEFRLAENRAENCGPDGVLTLVNGFGARVDGTFAMHNQTVIGRWVLTSWYGGGLRVVDIADPTAPLEAGAFVPKPLASVGQTSDIVGPEQRRTAATDDDWLVETWSYPIVRGGLIYVTDIRSGLYILRPAAGAPFAGAITSAGFAEGNSNLGDLV